MSMLVITGMEMPQICFMCRFCKKLWTEEGNFLSAECILTNDTLDQDDVNWFPYSCPLCEVPDWIPVWIPVDKRLPDHNCSTLICTENGKVFTAAKIDNSIKTPLNEQLDGLGNLLAKISYVIAGLIIVGRIGMYFINNDGFSCYSRL